PVRPVPRPLPDRALLPHGARVRRHPGPGYLGVPPRLHAGRAAAHPRAPMGTQGRAVPLLLLRPQLFLLFAGALGRGTTRAPPGTALRLPSDPGRRIAGGALAAGLAGTGALPSFAGHAAAYPPRRHGRHRPGARAGHVERTSDARHYGTAGIAARAAGSHLRHGHGPAALHRRPWRTGEG